MRFTHCLGFGRPKGNLWRHYTAVQRFVVFWIAGQSGHYFLNHLLSRIKTKKIANDRKVIPDPNSISRNPVPIKKLSLQRKEDIGTGLDFK